MSYIGMPELTVIAFMATMALVMIWPAATICRRLGFSPLLGVLIVVPVANVILLWYLALRSGRASRLRVARAYRSPLTRAYVMVPSRHRVIWFPGIPATTIAAGLKYSTIPAPTDASTNPT